MELYIHIPFCKSKCQYCDFVSFPTCDEEMNSYVSLLQKEILLTSIKFSNKIIETIFIGGGTPSILSIDNISKLVASIYANFNVSRNVEFTIECNPESITEEKLKKYKELGINRLSIGIQSLDDKNLKEIGRIHSSEMAIDKLKLASKYFENLSCDLIIGLPFDTKESIRNEVNYLSNFVSHISMYELIVEKGTKLYERVIDNSIELPSDDEVVDLFNVAIKEANNNGLIRYEVSNFAKNNCFSRHNFGYWTREEYIGIGLNSASLIKESKEVRFSNFKDLNKYSFTIKNANDFDEIERESKEVLSQKDIENEEIMLSLRTTKGIQKNKIEKLITKDLERYFIESDGYLSLTDEGISVMNSILVQIMK